MVILKISPSIDVMVTDNSHAGSLKQILKLSQKQKKMCLLLNIMADLRG